MVRTFTLRSTVLIIFSSTINIDCPPPFPTFAFSIRLLCFSCNSAYHTFFGEFLSAIPPISYPFSPIPVSFLAIFLIFILSTSTSSISGVNARGSSDLDLPHCIQILFLPSPMSSLLMPLPRNHFLPFLPKNLRNCDLFTKLSGPPVPERMLRKK